MSDAAILNVLIVEDEPLIAVDLAERLLEMGDVSVATAYNLEEALRVSRSRSFDYALLDFRLGEDTDSSPIAEILSTRGIPYAFATASIGEVSRSFPRAQILPKPIEPRALAALIEAARTSVAYGRHDLTGPQDMSF